MLVSTPAFELNPMSARLKFYAFDDFCLGCVRELKTEVIPCPNSHGAAAASAAVSFAPDGLGLLAGVTCPAGESGSNPAGSADEWTTEPTSPGGWHVVDPVLLGAMPVTEI